MYLVINKESEKEKVKLITSKVSGHKKTPMTGFMLYQLTDVAVYYSKLHFNLERAAFSSH